MARKSKETRRRHVPQRTCVACRKVSAARDLIRIVRLPDGAVELDETHKKSGRGAHLCRRRACWDIALDKKLLEHALKTEMSSGEMEALWQHRGSLPLESADDIGAQTTP